MTACSGACKLPALRVKVLRAPVLLRLLDCALFWLPLLLGRRRDLVAGEVLLLFLFSKTWPEVEATGAEVEAWRAVCSESSSCLVQRAQLRSINWVTHPLACFFLDESARWLTEWPA